MARLFYGNFDFEEQLHAVPGQRRPAAIERLVQELTFGFLGVATPQDRIWCPGTIPEPFLDWVQAAGWPREVFVQRASDLPLGLTLEPWGWSPEAVRFGQQHGVTVSPPPLDLVRDANSRQFSATLEQGGPLEFSRLCHSMDQVHAFLAERHSDEPWVIKANWSHAGRERILGRGPQLSPSAERWLTQRLARDKVVCAERWLDRLLELGVQWDVPALASEVMEPILIAVTELLVDPRGQYSGTRALSASDPRLAEIPDVAAATRPAVYELARRGYSGPVGIDAMLYRTQSGVALRPFQDINVRWTMGRLAAGWFEWFRRQPENRIAPAHSLTWQHGNANAASSSAESAQEVIATSPDEFSGHPVGHQTWLTRR